MKRSVHNFSFKTLLLFVTGGLMSLCGYAQTYTTQADGNWTSPATWVGGVVPGNNIAAGAVVNIKHDVNCNVSNDISISGTLNVTGDTLRFAASWTRKVTINSTGQLNVVGGGFIQNLPAGACELIINGGRVYFDNAKVTIGKNILATQKHKLHFKNSTVLIGEKFEMSGQTAANMSQDTIQKSTVEASASGSGNIESKNFANLVLGNAKITVNNGSFKNGNQSNVKILPGATGNFGIDAIKTSADMINDGSWDARVDAFCVGGNISGNNDAAIDFIRPEDCSLQPASAPAPELIFQNPVLVSGQDRKQGAVYKFSNVYPGVDATVKLVKFSRSDIVMASFDKVGMGWDKALQPEFGLPGTVPKNANWFIDFELNFYVGGTNTKKVMSKVDVTALDVDGDNNTVMEYAVFQNPTAVIYSSVSYLTNGVNVTPASLLCPIDGLLSPLLPCISCGGDGLSGAWNWYSCTGCNGTGQLLSLCNHAYDGTSGSTLQGPVDNFLNIDTMSTQVMATYQYFQTDKIKFRYGAKSGNKTSNGSGVRLNSLWFRQFSLAPAVALPVTFASFSAMYDKKNVNLAWSATEEDFSHYVLQRSTDGKEYSDVAVIFSNGGVERNEYKYKDANVSSSTGMLFYRLQMVDNTKEAVHYSEVRIIKLVEEMNKIQLTTYPNPVVDQLKITLPTAWQGKPVMLELFTANGTRVQNMFIGSASQTETLQVGKEAKGFYLVKASCGDQVAQQRVIKN